MPSGGKAPPLLLPAGKSGNLQTYEAEGWRKGQPVNPRAACRSALGGQANPSRSARAHSVTTGEGLTRFGARSLGPLSWAHSLIHVRGGPFAFTPPYRQTS